MDTARVAVERRPRCAEGVDGREEGDGGSQASAPRDGRRGPSGGETFVIRGGFFFRESP